MLMKLTSNKKILLIASSILLLIGLLIASVVFLILNLRLAEKTAIEPPLKFEYCRTNLKDLCVLSFARDTSGNIVINLFVPIEIPDFYLNVKRLTGEAVFTCEKVAGDETIVTCVGEALNLGEQIEITIISKDGDIPFAIGKFTLTAILVSPPTEDKTSPRSQTVTPDSPSGTESATPEVSYPSYP